LVFVFVLEKQGSGTFCHVLNTVFSHILTAGLVTEYNAQSWPCFKCPGNQLCSWTCSVFSQGGLLLRPRRAKEVIRYYRSWSFLNETVTLVSQVCRDC